MTIAEMKKAEIKNIDIPLMFWNLKFTFRCGNSEGCCAKALASGACLKTEPTRVISPPNQLRSYWDRSDERSATYR